jgi:hypothetical protein
MMDDLIKEAKQIIREKKVKCMPSENFGMMYLIEDHMVRVIKLAGRTEIHCDCPHGTRFCNSPVLCKHKLSVIILKAMILD